MNKLRNLMEKSITWGDYLKLCGWGFLGGLIVGIFELIYFGVFHPVEFVQGVIDNIKSKFAR